MWLAASAGRLIPPPMDLVKSAGSLAREPWMCPHCTNDRDLEQLGDGRVLCPVCSKESGGRVPGAGAGQESPPDRKVSVPPA